MREPFWLLTNSKTDFRGVFPLFPTYTGKDLCHSYVVFYGRILCGCDSVSWSLLMLCLNIPYQGLLMLRHWPFRGHFDLVLQFHGFVFGSLFFINFLLCELIMLDIFCTLYFCIFCNFHCISVEPLPNVFIKLLVKALPNVFISADKTTNMYRIEYL